jgi:hypothetical protein
MRTKLDIYVFIKETFYRHIYLSFCFYLFIYFIFCFMFIYLQKRAILFIPLVYCSQSILNYLDFKYFLTYLMKIIPDTTAGGLFVPIVLSSQ